MADRRSGWWPGITLLVVTLGVVAVYYRQLFEGLAPAGYDAQTYFFPLRAYTRAALLDGRIPLWTADVFMGAPILANPQAAVFYPLNLLLLPLAPATGLGATVILHVWIAGVGMALFARRVLRLHLAAAAVAALAFALGGVMSAQTGHPNQLAAIAWTPYLLWAVDRTVGRRGVGSGQGFDRVAPVTGLAAVMALQATAGHPQQVYMALLTAAGYATYRLARRGGGGEGWGSVGWGVGRLAAGLALGAGLSAVQLLPALFLSAQSIRAGGLPLYEAGSFSLRPGDLGMALLPAFTDAPRSQEFLAFVGFTGLWLAGVGLTGRRHRALALVVLGAGVLALLLAAGPELPFFRLAHRWLPGFDLFRVPARWLVVVNLSLALLAGLGVDRLVTGAGDGGRRLPVVGFGVGLVVMLAVGLTGIIGGDLPGRVPIAWLVVGLSTGVLVLAIAYRRGRLLWLLAPLIAVELFFAVRPLELATPIPTEAYTGAGPVLEMVPAESAGPRALGLADPSYEVNDIDRAAYASEYLDRIGAGSFREFLAAVKYRDTLSPNLANAYGRPSPDGYDGGVLPLRDYVRFKSAFLPGAETAPDALLRNQFDGIPEKWVLDLMGVGYLLTDRKDDLEIEGTFVDMEGGIRLEGPDERTLNLAAPVEVETVVVVGYSEEVGGARLELLSKGEVGATVTLPEDGRFQIVEQIVLATADGLRVVARSGAKVVIQGVTLTDSAGGQHAVVLSDDPVMDLIWWTDVKIYRLREPAPRAALVTEFGLAAGPEAAVAMMQEGDGLDSRRAVVLEVPDELVRPSTPVLGGIADWFRALAVLPPKGRFGVVDGAVRSELEAISAPGDGNGSWREMEPVDGRVDIVDYEPERVSIMTSSTGPGLLLLRDAIYPGWEVEIDGTEARLLRANVLHRAVLIPAGEHDVEFIYEPDEVATGGVISLIAWVMFAVLLVGPAVGRWRRREAGR